jgi:hypothetical protein
VTERGIPLLCLPAPLPCSLAALLCTPVPLLCHQYHCCVHQSHCCVINPTAVSSIPLLCHQSRCCVHQSHCCVHQSHCCVTSSIAVFTKPTVAFTSHCCVHYSHCCVQQSAFPHRHTGFAVPVNSLLESFAALGKRAGPAVDNSSSATADDHADSFTQASLRHAFLRCPQLLQSEECTWVRLSAP